MNIPLAQSQDKVRVVVELADEPAARVYAAAGGGPSLNAIRQARAQLNRIQLAQAAFVSALQAENIPAKEIYRTQRILNGVALELDGGDLRAVAALPGVRAVYPLVSKSIDHLTSVPLVGALQAWANTTPYRGEGVDIGIIDTGIDYTHRNFGGAGTGAAYQTNNPQVIEPLTFPTAKVVGGYDFVGNSYDARGLSGSSTPAPDPDPLDCNGHGSHVAGTAGGLGILNAGGANPAAGDYGGYAALSASDYSALFKIGPGVAPLANLYALKVFGCSGSTEMIDAAIEWAVDPNQDGDLSDHLDVINMSLGASFGAETDTTVIASNNAVLAGVIVVTAAGNSGDVYYIAGSPGAAELAISTANVMDSGWMTGGFEVVSTTTPVDLKGIHPAVVAAFGPALTRSGRTAGLAAAEPADGCTALTNAANVAGKIALIDRGGCAYTLKVQNAQTAGAVGVLVANNVPAVPFAMTGSSTGIGIPAAMTSQAAGAALRGALAGGVTVRLTSEYDRSVLFLDPSAQDVISPLSSRGPRRGDSLLKPDLAAPGDSIFSTAVGSGTGGLSLGGTSMASPHVAGAMALLLQARPAWTPQQLKALVMNTAGHDVYTASDRTVKAGPDRVGAGRMDLLAAVQSDLIAYASDAPGAVSVSFGFEEVVDTIPGAGVDLTTEKAVTIANRGATAAAVTVGFDSRYPANPGVSYTLLAQDGSPLSAPLSVPAGGSAGIKIRQQIDASQLARQIDPAAADEVNAFPREFITQSGGYLVVTPVALGEPSLRVPVYAVHRVAGARAALNPLLTLGAADEGELALPMGGSVVSNPDETPLVYVSELLHENVNDFWSNGIFDNADLMAVGAATNYTAQSNSDANIYITMATYGAWSTPLEVEFQVYIDIDEDGDPDWVGVNTGVHVFSGVLGDVYLSTVCPNPLPSDIAGLCGFSDTLNGDLYATGGKLNTNPFHSNVMTLALSAADLGLSAANSDFDFYVDTYAYNFSGLVDTTPWLHYDIARPVFDTIDTAGTGLPLWVDDTDLAVRYDKTDLYNRGGALGLLLTHHHNAGSKAELVHLAPGYAALVWDKYAGLRLHAGETGSVPVRVVNETDTACTFDLAASQAPDAWPVTLSTPLRYVPAHSSYTFNATVTAPAHLQGVVKEITLTATCREDPAITAATILDAAALAHMYLPEIHK